MRRLVALVAAVVMIMAAVVIRSRLDDDEVARTVRLVCASELEAVCNALSGRLQTTVEPAAVTADRLGATVGNPLIDGWLVPEPWPSIVNGRRLAIGQPVLFGSRQELARSPIVLVAWNDRAAALRGRCAGDVAWPCLGDAIARGPWTASGGRPEWGQIKPGYPAPGGSAVGLLVLGQAVTAWFGRPDFTAADLTDDDAFARWFTALERAVPVPDPPEGVLQRMFTAGPAAYDAVGTTEADVSRLHDAPRRNEVSVLYPSPMATADVVLASVGTGSAASSMRRLAGGADAKKALAAAGWRVSGEARAPGVPDTPALPRATNGLPEAGPLEALLRYRRSVIR